MAPGPRQTAHAAPPAAPLELNVFRQMAEMSGDAFYLVDSSGRFLYVNDRAVTHSGYSKVELYRMTVSDLNPEYPDASIAAGVQGVRTLIAAARNRGIRVMVGTLLPELSGDVNASAANLSADCHQPFAEISS